VRRVKKSEAGRKDERRRALSLVPLEEFQRVSDAAAARLRQATEAAAGRQPDTERRHTSEPPSA
jgi:hypothetical protein